MKKARLWLCLGLFWLLLSACGASEPLKIDSVALAKDNGSGSAGEIVTGFAPADRTFHAVVKLNRLETDLRLKLTWMVVEAGGERDMEVNSYEYTALAANAVDGQISLPNDWPTGQYRLDVCLNDKLAQSLAFTVA
jgi:hypothetical protein